jgi:hypothetical protein
LHQESTCPEAKSADAGRRRHGTTVVIILVPAAVLAYPFALLSVGVPADTVVGTTTALVLLAVEAVRRLWAIIRVDGGDRFVERGRVR